MRIKHFFFACVREGRLLVKRAIPMLSASAHVIAPLFAVLMLLPRLGWAWGTAGGWESGAQMAKFFSLLSGALLDPLFLAGCAYSLAARWEHRPFDLSSAFIAVKVRIGRVLLTGVVVWAVMMGLDMLLDLVRLLLQATQSLLGWIPLAGVVVSGVVTILLLLIANSLSFLGEAALICALLALLGDGLWGAAQTKQALRILWGGRTDVWPAMTTLFLLWLVGGAVMSACALLPWGAYATGAIEALRLLLLAGGMASVYLTERDRQDGVRLHAV